MKLVPQNPGPLAIWLRATRPQTLPAALCPVLIGAAMAYRVGPLAWAVLAATFLSALFIQIGTNYANDYFDDRKGADTPDRVGPRRATATGLVTPRQMAIATALAFTLAAAFGLYLVLVGGWPILVIGLLSLTCGVLYTAGPCALGYLGLGDLFVLIFFGPVAVAGTYYLQTQACSLNVIVASLAPGLISAAILTVNNFRDRFTDKQAGKKTLVVRWGETFGVTAYCVALVAACLTPVLLVLFTREHVPCLLGTLTLIAAIPSINTMRSDPSPEVLNRLLARTGQLLVLYSVLFSLGWLL